MASSFSSLLSCNLSTLNKQLFNDPCNIDLPVHFVSSSGNYFRMNKNNITPKTFIVDNETNQIILPKIRHSSYMVHTNVKNFTQSMAIKSTVCRQCGFVKFSYSKNNLFDLEEVFFSS